MCSQRCLQNKSREEQQEREGDRFLAAVCVSRRLPLNLNVKKILRVKYRFQKNQNEVTHIIKSMKCNEEKNEEKKMITWPEEEIVCL